MIVVVGLLDSVCCDLNEVSNNRGWSGLTLKPQNLMSHAAQRILALVEMDKAQSASDKSRAIFERLV